MKFQNFEGEIAEINWAVNLEDNVPPSKNNGNLGDLILLDGIAWNNFVHLVKQYWIWGWKTVNFLKLTRIKFEDKSKIGGWYFLEYTLGTLWSKVTSMRFF